MAISQQPMADESIPIEEIGTVPIRYHQRKYRVTVTDAIEAAGGVTGSIIYDVEMIDDLGGMLPAILSPDAVDGRQSKMGRSITTEGNEQRRVYRVTIPQEALEALGYDLDRVKEASGTDAPVGITVYAGPEMLAFERPERRTVQIDRSQFDAEEKRDYSGRDRDDEGQFTGGDEGEE